MSKKSKCCKSYKKKGKACKNCPMFRCSEDSYLPVKIHNQELSVKTHYETHYENIKAFSVAAPKA